MCHTVSFAALFLQFRWTEYYWKKKLHGVTPGSPLAHWSLASRPPGSSLAECNGTGRPDRARKRPERRVQRRNWQRPGSGLGWRSRIGRRPKRHLVRTVRACTFSIWWYGPLVVGYCEISRQEFVNGRRHTCYFSARACNYGKLKTVVCSYDKLKTEVCSYDKGSKLPSNNGKSSYSLLTRC